MNRPPACLRLSDERGNNVNESYWSGVKDQSSDSDEKLKLYIAVARGLGPCFAEYLAEKHMYTIINVK